VNAFSFIAWRDGSSWLGYLMDYPEYWTQGDSFQDLEDHLRDLLTDLSSDRVPLD